MEFFELAHARHSVRIYQPGLEISDRELRQIFDAVILSPSSFNIQHWKFVVVRDQERKTALRGLSFGQAQVEQSAAVILVCGSLDAYTDAARIYGAADLTAREKYLPMIEGSYAGQAALQREEAVRSGSLAAMSLMYAAKAAGWDSGPMIGFDAKKVGAMLHLDDNTVPIMMIVIGKALDDVQPERGYRRPVEEVVKLEFLDGDTLV